MFRLHTVFDGHHRIKAKESAALLKQEHENMLQQHKARKAAQQRREMELKAEKERENDRVIAEQAEIARRLLPPDQKTKIAEFQSVSGNNNFNEANSFLAFFDWKLEVSLLPPLLFVSWSVLKCLCLCTVGPGCLLRVWRRHLEDPREPEEPAVNVPSHTHRVHLP